MPLHIFAAMLLVAWAMVLAGGVIINIGWGLVAAGLLMLAIAMWFVRSAGLREPGKSA